MTHKTETRQDGDGKVVVEQTYNHLAPAEMMKEDNYNQIDGVLNNITSSTFEERMKKAKAKAHNNRKSERHKGARHSRKSERHKTDRHNNSTEH